MPLQAPVLLESVFKQSVFTWTVKWLLSVADELTISGSLNISFAGGLRLNILFPKL